MATRLQQQPMFKSLNFSASTDKVDCGTDFIGTGDVTVCGWVNPTNAGTSNAGRVITNGAAIFYFNSSGQLQFSSNSGATNALSSVVNYKKWMFVSVTRTSAGVVNFRINGVAKGSVNQSSGTPATASTNTIIGNNSAGTVSFIGKLKNIQVYNRILTTQEQDNIYLKGINPTDYATSIVRDFTFDNDTKTTVYSVNDISKTGTITGAFFTNDVPLKSRSVIGENLFKTKLLGNGSTFSPPGVQPLGSAAITTNGWIEDERLGVYFAEDANQASAKFDSSVTRTGNYTLKFSNIDTVGRCHVDTIEGASSTITSQNSKNLIPVLPNTTYTISFWYKTLNRASSSLLAIGLFNGLVRTTNTTYLSVSGTNDWTYATQSFTTGLMDNGMYIRFQNTAGAIEDNWIDWNSISLVKTAPTRSTASNRVVTRDMGTALSFDGVDDIVRATALTHLVINNPATISFNVFITEDSDGTIFANRLNTTDSNIHLGWRNSASRIEGAFFTAGAPNEYRGRFATPTLKKRQWYNVVIIYDGTTLNEGTNGTDLYLNGIIQAKVSANFGGAGVDNIMSFGGQATISAVANDLSGNINEFRTWNRALSTTEVSDLYFNNIVPRTGLVGEWLFNEASGSTALDTSGNGNNGTITGATYSTDTPLKIRTQS